MHYHAVDKDLGTGTEDDPWDVSGPDDLDKFAIPDGAIECVAAQTMVCSLCDLEIFTDEKFWMEEDCLDTASHRSCWLDEMNAASDPYVYYGVRRGDF